MRSGAVPREVRSDANTVRNVQVTQEHKPAPKVARIASQDYVVVKKECLTQGALWEDPSFPATNKSIYLSSQYKSPVEWRRPGDICKDPEMAIDGFTRFDVKQGSLNNCWFLAAIASLCATGNQNLFQQVVPLDNLFDKDYAGVFHFRIWQYGKWVDIAVDDRLPTQGGQLVYARSATDNEFWPALLEKAYAKLNGSYEALSGGSTSEAMQDFTGGVTEIYELRANTPKDLFTIMSKAIARDSLMGCSVDPKDIKVSVNSEDMLTNGLVVEHAYSITAVKEVTVLGRKVKLVRIRNPWANNYEWNGAWSDRSAEWTALSEADKKSLGLTFADDGEFWMSFNDFATNFSLLEMCMAAPTSNETRTASDGAKIKWEITTHDGSWKKYVNAGGCRNYLDTFWTNPQFTVQVIDPDDGDDNKTGTLIVALMQKNRRKLMAEGGKLLAIGFGIYKIPNNLVGPQNITFFRHNVAVACSPTFTDMRETVGRYRLPPGNYLIVPSTFTPNEEGEFLLRVFSEKPAPSTVVDEDTRLVDKPVAATVPNDTRKTTVVVTPDGGDQESDLKELFRRTAGSDLEIDAYELRSILDAKLKAEFKIEGVTLETARSMLAMMDLDQSGKLGYDEFKRLWISLNHWKEVFINYDASKRNCLAALEMRSALSTSGILVSNHTLNCLVMRYSDPRGYVQFDDFMLCVARLKTMFGAFRAAASDNAKLATFTLDQFIQTTMYA